jgi:hypothetical protein
MFRWVRVFVEAAAPGRSRPLRRGGLWRRLEPPQALCPGTCNTTLASLGLGVFARQSLCPGRWAK